MFKVNIPKGLSIDNLLHSGFIGQGKYVDIFEKKFAEHFELDSDKVISVNSCTSAIQLGLELEGISIDDDIVTPAYTCLATNSDILRRGANIIWYDVNKITGLSKLNDIKKVITPNTKIVIIAHLSGTITDDLEKILDFCHLNNIKVIEDSAQSLGAKFNDRYVNSKFDYVAFSFQAIKHLTTIDGGILYCNDSSMAKEAKLLRWFGFDRKSSSDFRCTQNVKKIGMKIHMTDIPAYIGIKSLDTIDEIIDKHIKNANIYYKEFERLDGIIPAHSINSGSSFWVFPIIVENDRDGLKKYLSDHNIHSSLVQNRLDKMTCFEKSLKLLPQLDYFMDRILHIPCGWWLKDKDIYNISKIIKEFV